MVSTLRYPVPASLFFTGFAAQAKLARFVSAGSTAHHTLRFSLNPGDASDRNLTGRGVLTTLPFVGLCGLVGAQSTAQPWHADPLAREHKKAT